MNFEQQIESIKEQIFGELKQELKTKAREEIEAQIPFDTGELLDSLSVEWEGDDLVASTQTEYDSFVRNGFVHRSGTIVDGFDYFDINLDQEP